MRLERPTARARTRMAYAADRFLSTMRHCICMLAANTLNDAGVPSSDGRVHGATALRIGAHGGASDKNDQVGFALSEGARKGTRLHRGLRELILVEPHPDSYAALSRQLSSQRAPGSDMRAVADNSAACGTDRPGNVTFYSIEVANSTSRQDDTVGGVGAGAQFSSMSWKHVYDSLGPRKGHLIQSGRVKIVTLPVPCYSIETLLARHGARPRDVRILTVDAEGYDVEILDGGKWGVGHLLPRLLVFEWFHVGHTPAARALVERLAANHSYACVPTPPRSHGLAAGRSQDMWCIHRSVAHVEACDTVWMRHDGVNCGRHCGW